MEESRTEILEACFVPWITMFDYCLDDDIYENGVVSGLAGSGRAVTNVHGSRRLNTPPYWRV